jgi:AmmeMemoRadiSam system protein A
MDGQQLVKLARSAIESSFGMVAPAIADAPWLQQPGATFVTLTRQGHLRGCIGSLEAHRSLREDVIQNALAAAFRDRRFLPLEARELPDLKIEVSLLSPQQPIDFTDESDALAKLRPHQDGIVFECGPCRSTFLPQVWEQLPSPREFMAYLKRKAGLADNFWSPEVRLFRYTVEKWKE